MSLGQRTLERVMGVPMAAPESAEMKKRRRNWTVSMFALALLLIATSFGPASSARVLAVAFLPALLFAAVLGYKYLSRKRAIDDAWLAAQVAKEPGA